MTENELVLATVNWIDKWLEAERVNGELKYHSDLQAGLAPLLRLVSRTGDYTA